LNKGKTTCTNAQWCAAGAALPGIYPDRGSFSLEYKSRQTLFRERVVKAHRTPLLVPRPDMTISAPKILAQVWENARPSVWRNWRRSETPSSTPLGIASTPQFPVPSSTQIIRCPQPVPVSAKFSDGVSVAIIWSNDQQDAARGAPQFSSEICRVPLTARRVDDFVRGPVEMTSLSVPFTSWKGCIDKLSYDPWDCSIPAAQNMQTNHLSCTPIIPHEPERPELPVPGASLVDLVDHKSINERHGRATLSELPLDRSSPV
jgi:hypothetical protein